MKTPAVEGSPIYWHRQLPPADAQPVAEHTVESASARVRDTVLDRDELWRRCEEDLMRGTQRRLIEEMRRLGGRYAHVLSESIDMRHDAATGEAWLHGRFTYMLYR